MASSEDLFFSKFLVTRYPIAKSQHPTEGRRKWRLRVINQFWDMPSDMKDQVYNQSISQAEPDDESDFFMDGDPLDEITDGEASGIGILVRTDYSNEDAWLTFSEDLRKAEQEFTSSNDPDDNDNMIEENSATTSTSEDQMDEDDGGTESGSSSSSPIIIVINAPLETRGLFEDISNLTALRLLNDVDLTKIALPANTIRATRPNRLIDLDGWQEVYHGKTIWIYDAKSNVDKSARLVSQHPDFYGTATGDSWRARVTHICELQINVSSGAMTIDFGGMDRYDYAERVRNLAQANA